MGYTALIKSNFLNDIVSVLASDNTVQVIYTNYTYKKLKMIQHSKMNS